MAQEPLLFHKDYPSITEVTNSVPLIILHGLFGTLDNWHNIARKIQSKRRVIGVDLRNHGKSFHSDDMTLELMAQDLDRLIEHLHLESFDLLGHSMGGKVALQYVNSHPGKVNKLIVADIAPRSYPSGHDLIFDVMLNLPISEIENRKEAEEHLQAISDQGVRLFILKNVERKASGGFQWKINLDAIHRNYKEILNEIPSHWPYDGPVLFMKGERSNYINENDEDVILEEYPSAEFVSIPNAGHWIHADNPGGFVNALEEFLVR